MRREVLVINLESRNFNGTTDVEQDVPPYKFDWANGVALWKDVLSSQLYSYFSDGLGAMHQLL